jgi:hypothetical protein
MNILYFLGAVLLYGVYGALVLLGKTAPDGYVATIVAGLTFLGKHASTTRQAAGKPAADGSPAAIAAGVQPTSAVVPPPVVASTAAPQDAAPTLQ